MGPGLPEGVGSVNDYTQLEDGHVRSWELYTGGKPGIRYEWNGSLTVNVLRHVDGDWYGFDCFTFSEEPADDMEVQKAVIRRHREMMGGDIDPRYTEHKDDATKAYLMGGYDPALEPRRRVT